MAEISVETDSLEHSTLGSDCEQSQEFGAVTIDYVRWCLGFDDKAGTYEESALNPCITNFKTIGHALVERCSLGEFLGSLYIYLRKESSSIRLNLQISLNH